MFTPEQILGDELSLLVTKSFPKEKMSFDRALFAQSLLNDILILERDGRAALESDVESIISNLFPIYHEISDGIEIRAHLSDSVSFVPAKRANFEINKLDDGILKKAKSRKVMNMFIHGSAMNVHGAHHMSNFLSSDDKLHKLYDEIMSINTSGIYSISSALIHIEHTAGRVDVFFENGKWVIDAHALIFPVLIHEVVKGIYELIMLSCVQEWDKGVVPDVYALTDSKFDEVMDIRYGNILYSKYRDYLIKHFQKEMNSNPILLESSLKTLMLNDISFVRDCLTDVMKDISKSEKMTFIISSSMK
jgi:hypothetical protein